MPRGGVRPGAGRKPSEPATLDIGTFSDPMSFLTAAMNHSELDMRLRIDAARALLPFVHVKKDEGKKEEKAERAKSAGNGKFSSAKPPKLKLIRPDGE